jgi:hypothetical protein
LNETHFVPGIKDKRTLKRISEKYDVGKEGWIYLL